MNSPDGIQERTEFYDSAYERDLDEADVSEQLADDAAGNSYTALEVAEITSHAVHSAYLTVERLLREKAALERENTRLHRELLAGDEPAHRGFQRLWSDMQADIAGAGLFI